MLRLNNLRHWCKKQLLIISRGLCHSQKLETWYYSPACFTSRSRASLRRNEQDSPAVEMRQERILQLFSSSYKGNLLLLSCFSCLCFPPTLTQKLNSHTGKEKKKDKPGPTWNTTCHTFFPTPITPLTSFRWMRQSCDKSPRRRQRSTQEICIMCRMPLESSCWY